MIEERFGKGATTPTLAILAVAFPLAGLALATACVWVIWTLAMDPVTAALVNAIAGIPVEVSGGVQLISYIASVVIFVAVVVLSLWAFGRQMRQLAVSIELLDKVTSLSGKAQEMSVKDAAFAFRHIKALTERMDELEKKAGSN